MSLEATGTEISAPLSTARKTRVRIAVSEAQAFSFARQPQNPPSSTAETSYFRLFAERGSFSQVLGGYPVRPRSPLSVAIFLKFENLAFSLSVDLYAPQDWIVSLDP
jgi:hypothetical protein